MEYIATNSKLESAITYLRKHGFNSKYFKVTIKSKKFNNMQPINVILILPRQNCRIPCYVPVFDFDIYNLTTKELAFNIFVNYVDRMRNGIIHILKNHRVMNDSLM